MNVIYYLLEANFYLLVFFGVYKLLFKNDTFFSLNRFYLLISSLLAFVLPLIQLSGLRSIPAEHQLVNFKTVEVSGPENLSFWTPVLICQTIYFLVVLVSFTKFGLKLYQIINLINNNEAEKHKGYKKILIPGSGLAFSFFNYLFIDNKLPGQKTICFHEQVHIRHFHTLDVLFFEILGIICWFNPLLKYINKEIKIVHEFIADEETLKYEMDAEQYSLFLIGNSADFLQGELVSEMFSTPSLKMRIVKLFQTRSPQEAKRKYLVCIPLLLIIPCFSSLIFMKEYGLVDLLPAQSVITGPSHTLVNRTINSDKDAAQHTLDAPKTSQNRPVAKKKSDRPVTLPKNDNMPKTSADQIWINATTDTVKIKTIPAVEGRQRFRGIYVIEDQIYTEKELRTALKPTGELVVIFPRRPMLVVFTEKDDRAVKEWGDRANEGVIIVRSKKDLISNN